MPPPSSQTRPDIDEHLLSIPEVCTRYDTYIDEAHPNTSLGLNHDQVERVRYEHGPNLLSPPKQTHPIVKFLQCLTAVFNLLLIFAGVLTLSLFGLSTSTNLPDLYLGIALITVAFLNAVIEFVQLQKSANLLNSFLGMVPPSTYVVRQKKVQSIPAADLVHGDVVLVKMGDKVPADIRLISCLDLKVDNSSLTGETDPQLRVPHNDHTNPLEATNLMFSGTLVVSGEGYGIVIRTGDSTVLGQIANMASSEVKSPSPLSTEIAQFVKMIALVATITASFFFVISQIRYQEIRISLNFAIGTFVAFVPEGLPATVTMLLTVAASRMAKQKVLVKDLQGVETLGAITLLATDKTGTLTKNEMTVACLWINATLHESMLKIRTCTDKFSEFTGLKEILMIATLNSQVKFDRRDVPFEERSLVGDATEQGLSRFAYNELSDYDELPNQHIKVFSIPFNSETKWALSVHELPHANGRYTLLVKGAPERVLRLCSKILLNGSDQPLLPKHIDEFKAAYELMAGKGHRVIAFAHMQLQGREQRSFTKDNVPTSDLTFVGLCSLEDPPKHGVREAIGKCRSAGIQVIMVTGDHPLTAEAISRKINLMISDTKAMVAEKTMRPIESIKNDEYDAIVIHGEEIDQLDDEGWDHIFSKKEIIFARTSPKQKLDIVKRAQSIGHIVGVTGDGVNDSPALKKADLGISMNESGSDVSKEAAAMILLDDNFASTVRGIEEGRLIFANLKTSVKYTLTHSMPEILPQLLFVLVPIPLPLPSIMILFIDLGFELLAALSYAWDPPETSTGLMKLPPRKPVHPTSIARLRRRRLRELPPRMDFESRTLVPPSRFQIFRHSIGQVFTKAYWNDLMEPTDEQVTVDLGTLSWAYFEAGLIEAGVCLLAFFFTLHQHGVTIHDSKLMQNKGLFKSGANPHLASSGVKLDDQMQLEALSQAQSAYFMSLMIMQSFNLFACKSKLRSPWGRHMFLNPKNFVGLLIGLTLGLLLIFVPPLANLIQASPKMNPMYGILLPFCGGILLLIYTTLRFWVMRRVKPSPFLPEIVGLQMHPTVYTKYNRI